MSLIVSTSRRTGPAATKVLHDALARQKKVAVFMWQPDDPTSRDNPYLAMLGAADAVVVTGDSVSMVSEAATAGKPVYVWLGDMNLPSKFKVFLDTMITQGRVRLWGGRLNLRAPAAPLMDTAIAVGFIKARFATRG